MPTETLGCDVYRNVRQPSHLALLVDFGADNPKQTMHPIAKRRSLLEQMQGRADAAMTVSAYGRLRTRALANLQQLTSSFLDLEVHKSGYKHFGADYVAAEVIGYCERHGIPLPSEIVFSGRGVHLYWVYAAPVPWAAYPRWYRVQQALAERFAPFCPDRGALDGARCLRVVGSINSRSGERVRCLWRSTSADWGFDTLAHELLPIPRSELQQRKAERAAAKVAAADGAESKRPPQLWTVRQLCWNRYQDLRRLADLRGWSTDGVCEGYRHNYLRFTGAALAWGGCVSGERNIEAEIRALGTELTPSLSTSHVADTARRYARLVANGQLVRVSNDTIIGALEISRDEQRRLTWLYDSATMRERKRDMNRRANRKECDRATYEARAAANREAARRLRAEGLSRAQIADRLTVSVYTVDSYFRHCKPPQPAEEVFTISSVQDFTNCPEARGQDAEGRG